VISEPARIRRLSADLTDAESLAREVAERLSRLHDPDASVAALMLQELATLSVAVHDAARPPESPAIVSRLMCISARCNGPLGGLRKAVDRAAGTSFMGTAPA